MHSSVFYLQDRHRFPFKSRAGFSCASQCGSLASAGSGLIAVEPSQGPAAVRITADTSSAINSHDDLAERRQLFAALRGETHSE